MSSTNKGSFLFIFSKGDHIIKKYKKWKDWQKRCINSRFHKFLVLIGFVHSPSFEAFITRDERGRIAKFLIDETINKYHYYEIDLNTIEKIKKILSETDRKTILSNDGAIEIHRTYSE